MTSVHPARRVLSSLVVGATIVFLSLGMVPARLGKRAARMYISALLSVLIVSHANARFDAPAGGLLQAWCRPTTGFSCVCGAPTVEDVMTPETLVDLLMDLVALGRVSARKVEDMRADFEHQCPTVNVLIEPYRF